MSSSSPKVSVEDARNEKDVTNIEEAFPSPMTDLKMHHDGSTILVPQPSSDPNDPLNWSVMKKHVFLFVIAVTAFLPDYGSSTGAITNLVQPAFVSPLYLLVLLHYHRPIYLSPFSKKSFS